VVDQVAEIEKKMKQSEEEARKAADEEARRVASNLRQEVLDRGKFLEESHARVEPNPSRQEPSFKSANEEKICDETLLSDRAHMISDRQDRDGYYDLEYLTLDLVNVLPAKKSQQLLELLGAREGKVMDLEKENEGLRGELNLLRSIVRAKSPNILTRGSNSSASSTSSECSLRSANRASTSTDSTSANVKHLGECEARTPTRQIDQERPSLVTASHDVAPNAAKNLFSSEAVERRLSGLPSMHQASHHHNDGLPSMHQASHQHHHHEEPKEDGYPGSSWPSWRRSAVPTIPQEERAPSPDAIWRRSTVPTMPKEERAYSPSPDAKRQVRPVGRGKTIVQQRSKSVPQQHRLPTQQHRLATHCGEVRSIWAPKAKSSLLPPDLAGLLAKVAEDGCL